MIRHRPPTHEELDRLTQRQADRGDKQPYAKEQEEYSGEGPMRPPPEQTPPGRQRKARRPR